MNAKIVELYIVCLNWIKSHVWILLVFVLAFLFRFFLIESNPYIQTDEPSSFYISAPSVVSDSHDFYKKDWDGFNIKKQKNFSGAELNNLLFKPDSSIKSLIDDIRLTRLQAMDRQHPSLYFALLRIWDNNIGEFEQVKYLKHGRMLNLVFFCFSFFFMYKLLALIKNDKKFIAFALVFAFLNVGSIALAVLVREYALQETFFILSTYYALIFYKKIESGVKFSIKTSILSSLAFAMFLTSGYFSLVYYVILQLSFFLKVITRNKKLLINLGFMGLLTLIFTLLLCPNYFDFKTDNEHYNYVASAFSSLGILVNQEVLLQALKYLLKNLIYPFFVYSIPLIILLSRFNLITLKESFTEKEKNVIVCLVILVGFWITGVLFLTPYKCLRYFAAGLSVFSLITPLLISNFRLYLKQLLTVAFVMLTLVSFTTGVWFDKYDRPIVYQEETTNSLPSVVVNPTFFFLDYAFLSLNKNNIVRFEDKTSLKNLPIKGLYKLVCDVNTKPASKSTPKCIWNMRLYLVSNPMS